MQPIKLLYVEDNEGDIVLFSDAVKHSHIDFELDIARNGYEAMQFLKTKNSHEEMPDLLLLDINMPVMNGLELLDTLKSSDNYKHMPVVMFTSSSSKNDVLISYRKYASSYLIKPYLEKEYDELVDGLNRYWRKLATLPD